MQEYQVKKGFGRGRVKEYFAVQADGDTLGGIVAGPFESERQTRDAIEGLAPMYDRNLHVIGGHLDGWRFEISRLN
jgi:hypothetical protein